MADQLGLSDKNYVQGDSVVPASTSLSTNDIGSADAAEYFQGSYKGVLNLSQLTPGRLVTVDITQDDPKKYEVVRVGSDVVQVRDPETREEFLIPIHKVSLVDLQTPYDEHELDKYSMDPNTRRLAQEKSVEKRKRHEGNPEKDSDDKNKSKNAQSKSTDEKTSQGQSSNSGKTSLTDRFKARMYPSMPGNPSPDDRRPTDQSGVGIQSPRLSHMVGKYRGFLDANKK
jgi:hypothetical protein